MASVQRLQLLSGTITADSTGSAVSLEPYNKQFIGWLNITAFTATTADVKIQHSANGTHWVDWATFAQATAIGTKTAYPLTSGYPLDRCLGFVRAVVDLDAGATSVTLDVAIYYDKS